MENPTEAGASPAPTTQPLETVAPPGVTGTLAGIKDTFSGDFPVAPNMPALGERVLLTALFGRMVHPEKPEVEHELDVGKLTRAIFDWWHANLWRAGRIQLGEI